MHSPPVGHYYAIDPDTHMNLQTFAASLYAAGHLSSGIR
jgi:hypothetical protein